MDIPRTKSLFAIAVAIITFITPVFADPVDEIIDDQMAHHRIPGLALEIIQNGKPIKTAGYGLANLEWQTPVTPNTVFEIGSVTKQFTAAAILLLAQNGKLSINDKISRYLADTPPSWSNITIRHLLTHTSGIKNYTVLDGFDLSRHLTQAEFIRKIGAQSLDFAPGEKWSYSNSSYNLLGFIIENVSGHDYWHFMRRRIFAPLGMNSTTNRDPRGIIPFRASGYETDSSGHYVNRDYEITDIFSAGAIVSTVEDLANWNASLDARTLLTKASEQIMWTPVRLNNGSVKEYGCGWFMNPLNGHQNIGHSGSTDGFSASIQRFPKDGLAVIVLTNSNEEGIATKVAKSIALLFLNFD